MTKRRPPWVWGMLILILLVGLPVLAHWSRQEHVSRCSLDGVAIDSRYRVVVVEGDRQREFCCLHCAGIWLERHPGRALKIIVTDETSGEVIDAATAYYVRSAVVTTRTTRNRIHTFRHQADAEEHAARFGGVVLPASERPFPGYEGIEDVLIGVR